MLPNEMYASNPSDSTDADGIRHVGQASFCTTSSTCTTCAGKSLLNRHVLSGKGGVFWDIRAVIECYQRSKSSCAIAAFRRSSAAIAVKHDRLATWRR